MYQEYMERLVVRYIIPLVTVTWISVLAKLAHIGILHREWNNLALLETTTTWSQGNSLPFDHSRGRSHSLSSYKPKLLIHSILNKPAQIIQMPCFSTGTTFSSHAEHSASAVVRVALSQHKGQNALNPNKPTCEACKLSSLEASSP